MFKPLQTFFAPAPLAPPELIPAAMPAPDFWLVDEDQIRDPRSGTCYELFLDTFFQARHWVTISGHPGPVHEHTYRVQVRCRSRALSATDQTIIGYQELREAIRAVATAYDSQLLNALPPFRRLQPTSEIFAAVLFQQLDRLLTPLDLTLTEITLWESPTVAIGYSRPRQL